jgi:peptide/nickel transport system substrate-binding protein
MRFRACLRWSAVLLAVGLPVAACSGGNTTASPGGRSILYVTASEEMSDLNPFTGSLQGKTQIFSVIGTPMLYINQSNQVTSQSLSSWKVSNGDKTVTLTLKPGMKWSDGKPMTSADMKMTLLAYLDSTISLNAGRVGAIEGQDTIGKDTTTPLSQLNVSGLATPNKQTLQITLATPDVAWIAQFGLNGDYWPILPEHILGKDNLATIAKDNFFKTWPVSSGPYTLQKWVNEQYVEVKQNPHWIGGKPGFQHVVFEIVDQDQMQAQLQTGQLQFIYPLDPSQVATVKAIKGVTVIQHEGVAPDTIGLNYAATALKDPRVRQAMLYAIDRQAICKTALAGHCTISTPNIREIGPAWSLPTTGLNEYTYDPAKAKALLAAAHWNPSTQLVFLTRTADAAAYVEQAMTIMQGQLAAVGIKVKLENVSTAELLDLIDKKAGWDGFWVSGANFAVDPAEMAGYMQCSQRYPNGANTSQFCNPQVDTLFDKGLTQTDQSQRGATYKQIFTVLNHDPSEIYLYNVNAIAAYDSHLKGPIPFGYVSGAYWNIGDWHWQN